MSWLRFVKLWIVLSTLASVAGWTLSAVGMLNKTGYVVFAMVVVVLGLLFCKSSLFSSLASVRDFRKLRRRLRRFLPAAFVVLTVLVFISGMLYAPNGHTALSYRFSRVLQWLSHEQWFWIHTANYRMNNRACGIEWLTAPFLLFLRSDRAVFLLNAIPFVLMPGLVFSVWTRMGVRPRVAWAWMWLLPTGYCFLLQAGGVANDAFPTVYALAMMDFALRARQKAEGRSQKPDLRPLASDLRLLTSDLCLSLLSAALLTGAKASNLPLLLPWAIIVAPLLPRVWSATRNTQHTTRFTFHVLRWSFVLLISAVVSFLPTAMLNIRYLHSWSGLNVEHAGMAMKNPFAGIIGNAFLLFTNNFVPTFFPFAGWWNHNVAMHLPAAFVRLLDANFEGGYNTLGEMPTEDWSGLGFGLSVLVLLSILAAWKYSRNTEHARRNTFHVSRFILLISPWISLLAYCAKTGMVTPARLITPYYPFLLPLLLLGAGHAQVVRRRWWKMCAGVSLLLALAALVVTPPRPLWPWRTVLDKALATHSNQLQLQRAKRVYEVYGWRSDPLAGVREWFPKDLKVIGFLGTDDDIDISLWKPYGSRRVERILITDQPDEIRKRGFEYALISGLDLGAENTTIQSWLITARAELIATTNATMTVSQGPEPWYFVRLKP